MVRKQQLTWRSGMSRSPKAPTIHAGSPATLAAHTRALRGGQRSKLLMTNGCFDPLHHGHVRGFMLASGRILSNFPNNDCALIVALNSDESVRQLKGEKRPFIREADRAFMLSVLVCVSLIVVFDTEEQLNYLLDEAIKPDAYFKGDDYADHPSITSRHNAFVVRRTSGISSSGLVAGLEQE